VNKTALITGVSSGIGQALVTFYLDQGYNVIGLGRRDQARQDKRYLFLTIDFSDRESVIEILKTVVFPELDIVYLNAGVLGAIEDMSESSLEAIDEVMQVNVWANKLLLDRFIEQEIVVKEVIAISSGAAVNGSRGWGAYSLSKATLNMLIKLYARQMRKTHLTALAPGLVETPMLRSIITDVKDERFSSVEVLRQSEEEGKIRSPKAIVEHMDGLRDQLKEYESGSFLDVRSLS
jgi:NAD(P)-dependent dehydrogenase (short-subunit alcohol dehydrogenase family)